MSIVKKIGLIGTLAGTMIGAGIFSLPYVFNAVGATKGILFLLFFSIVYAIVHSMYARLIIKNPGMEFGSIAKKYLGTFGSAVQWLIVGELLLVCLAYLILAPEFFLILFGGNYQLYILCFWIFGIFGMLLPMKWIEISETVGLIGIFGLIGVVGLYGLTLGNSISWNKEIITLPQLLLPFGPLLFAFSGRPSIVRIVSALEKTEKKYVYSIVIWGTSIPAFLYGVYTLGMLRMGGGSGVLDAISSFPWIIPSVLAALGIIVLWTSYFVVGINVRDILVCDAHVKKITAFLVASCVPLILSFFGIKDFIKVISFIGGVFLALEGIFIVTMWWRQATKNIFLYLSSLIFIIFCIALVQEVILFI